MCGIAIIIGAQAEEADFFARRANRLLHHRGPDGEGFFKAQEITMVHRRLAILDLSACGHQPMHSKDSRYVMVYNGEIYNHLELRKRFLADHVFNGHSDTETLLALYEKMGETMLSHLVGMWALAIWDRREKTLFITRDRFGQKPLYYRRAINGTLSFASEIKPLLGEDEQPVVHAEAVAEYLSLGNYGHLGHRTFFKDVFHFRQGHYALLKYGEHFFEEKPYWSIPATEHPVKAGYSEALGNALQERLQEAVKSQMLSDVKISATLSGGLDSSAVVGFMMQQDAGKTDVFTAQSTGTRWDESDYAKAVRDKWGEERIALHAKELGGLHLAACLEKYVRIQEEPFGDPSIIAHGCLIEMAKAQGAKVILNGQGADELFFGYTSMMSALLSQGVRQRKWTWVFQNLQVMRWPSTEVYRIFLTGWFPRLARKWRMYSRKRRRFFLRKDFLHRIIKEHVNLADASDFYSVWKEAVYGMYLPHLLHYDDRNCMACSVEGRMPFMDHRIWEWVAGISPDLLLKDGRNKQILRQAARSVLPESVLARKDKIGFYTPLEQMLLQDSEWIEGTLRNCRKIGSIVKPGVWEKDLQALRSKTASMDQVLRLWRILCLSVWLNAFQIDCQG